MLSSSALQLPLPEEVSISMTDPAVVSAVLGTYVALSVVAFGVNVPVPVVVQMPEPVEEVPFSGRSGLFLHATVLIPAFTEGASEMVSTIASETALHCPLPVVVSEMVTVPAAVSAALGV